MYMCVCVCGGVIECLLEQTRKNIILKSEDFHKTEDFLAKFFFQINSDYKQLI